jgi:predicted small metal-binding protein
MKRFRCQDIGQKCGWVQSAATVGEMMPRIEEHARTAHGITVIPADLKAKIEAAIRDIPDRTPRPPAAPRAPSGTSPPH